MIEEVKTLLEGLKFSKAAIVDDAYDEFPEVGNLNEGAWARFFDDISDQVESLLRTAFGEAAYDRTDPDALRRGPASYDHVGPRASWEGRRRLQQFDRAR